ncbi:MAG: pyridoxamine kinase [Oscillospiraceae bacterium]
MLRPKRVALINDLSVFGRCSLSVAAPIISVMGSQALPIPTTILSTHTGGFQNIHSVNCDGFVHKCAQQYHEIGLEIECIYSGYLANEKQFSDTLYFMNCFPKSFIVVDPVLGDNGRLYKSMDIGLVNNMRHLIKSADIITPNPTEACLLSGTPYKSEFSDSDISLLISKIRTLTDSDIIITGIESASFGKCNLCCTNKSSTFYVPCDIKHPSYHGTGDCFAATIVGAVLRGDNLREAVCCATDFIEYCIELTVNSDEPQRDGIFLEHALPRLINYKPSKKIIEMR